MADRTRRGPKKFLKYVTQFLDPKFNPERRGAMQMLAAAPLAGKLKLAQGALSPTLDPALFYDNLMKRMLGEAVGKEYAPMMFVQDRADLASRLYGDLWNRGRSIQKGAEYGVQSAYDDLADSGRLTESLGQTDPYMGGDPEAWARLKKAHEALPDESAPDFEELEEAYQEAYSDYISTMNDDDVISNFGDDDLHTEYMDSQKVDQIHEALEEETERLYGPRPSLKPEDWGNDYHARNAAFDAWEANKEELAKRLGLPQFLDKAQGLGQAADDYVDYQAVPEWYYKDPESLRYASMRNLLDHPALTPKQLMDVTGADPARAIAGLTPERFGEDLFHKLRPQWRFDPARPGVSSPFDQGNIVPSQFESELDLDKLHPEVRQGLFDYIENYQPSYGWDSPNWKQAVDDMRKRLSVKAPELTQLGDVPSYIGNRTSPFRVRYNKRDAARKSVAEPLPYLDVIRALPSDAADEYVEAASIPGHVGVPDELRYSGGLSYLGDD